MQTIPTRLTLGFAGSGLSNNSNHGKERNDHRRTQAHQGGKAMSEQNTPCPCANWARSINLKYLTNHHPNCPHYNDSLMDVWKVSDGNSSYYHDNEKDARRDMEANTECGV